MRSILVITIVYNNIHLIPREKENKINLIQPQKQIRRITDKFVFNLIIIWYPDIRLIIQLMRRMIKMFDSLLLQEVTEIITAFNEYFKNY